ncbi:hypothetical protein O1611_g1200 [Lasiodiplodia mahajangana]|uniref:Uncharacterized protein n=1 Tax=Lasiodiplodia mahajangana TaxID=1108764 RepID=A0ACC2JYJ8_9PEZI|nr:hypothetical protein O1611_g1200 [Lasiodiplodia mahajangana]
MSQTTTGVIFSTTSLLSLFVTGMFIMIPPTAAIVAMIPVLVAFYIASAPQRRDHVHTVFLSILRVFALTGSWPAWFWGPQQLETAENENENENETESHNRVIYDSDVLIDSSSSDEFETTELEVDLPEAEELD